LTVSLSLTAEQIDALEHVLGCVYDNERDTGTDGIGNDMLASIEHHHDQLYPLHPATDGTYHWDIPFHIAGLVEFFIDCYGDFVYYVDAAETQERNTETVLAPVRAQLLMPEIAGLIEFFIDCYVPVFRPSSEQRVERQMASRSAYNGLQKISETQTRLS